MKEKQINFKKYSSIKIGTNINVKIAQTIDEALYLRAKGYFIIGKVNNIILNDNPANKIRIFQLGDEFRYIKDSADYVEVGGRSVSREVFLYFKKQDIGGLEFLGTLPGSIGGIVRMNAGMKSYEIKDAINSVCIDGVWVDRKNIDFKYRNSGINGVISAVRFHKNISFRVNLESEFQAMRANQPLEPSCGSCFKNPIGESAGKLLDLVGLRGFRLGGMAFSNKHANFLVNLDNGTFNEALELIHIAKARIYERYAISLENEIVIIH